MRPVIVAAGFLVCPARLTCCQGCDRRGARSHRRRRTAGPRRLHGPHRRLQRLPYRRLRRAAGNVDRSQWLLGSPLGYRGPWGTTYAANLRLALSEMHEAQWMAYSGDLHTRPPMPDFSLRAMREDDRRAIYRLVRSLGPTSDPVPAYLPPGQQPPPPYMELVLPTAEPAAAAAH